MNKFNEMNDSQIISFLMNEHYLSIYHTAKKVKYKYKRIPLEWEDLFNICLVSIPGILRRYDESFQIKIGTYISYKAMHIMANHARKYITKNQEIMNNYIQYEKLSNLEEIMSKKGIDLLSDSQKTRTIEINIENFTKLECNVFREYFLNDKSIKECAVTLNCSFHVITNATKRIRNKVRKKNKKINFY